MEFKSSRRRNAVSAAALGCFACAIGYLVLHDVSSAPTSQAAPPSETAPAPDAAASPPPDQTPKPALTQPRPRPARPSRPAPPAQQPFPQPAAENEPIPNLQELDRRVKMFRDKMARYRAKNPVFIHFVNRLDDTLLPLAENAINANLEIQERGLQVQQLSIEEAQRPVLALLRDLGVETLDMAQSGKLDLPETAISQLRDLVEEANAAAQEPVVNPHPVQSPEYYAYDYTVGTVAYTASRSFFTDFLQYSSPELERERDFLDDEYRRLTANNPDMPEFDIDADPYEDLVNERLRYLKEIDEWATTMSPKQKAAL